MCRLFEVALSSQVAQSLLIAGLGLAHSLLIAGLGLAQVAIWFHFCPCSVPADRRSGPEKANYIMLELLVCR